MSITDELRHNIEGAEQLYGCECKHLLAIADRIDAEHEESIQREHESAYDAGYAEGMGVANKADMRAEYLRGKNDGYDEGWDAGFASADDWLAQHEDAMAEHGWVRKDKEHIISHATIEVTPHIDWSRMADELNEFVEIVRGMLIVGHSSTRTNGLKLRRTQMQFTDEQQRFIDEHYQLLPKDADGEYIHVGDEMCGYGWPNGGVYCRAIVNEVTILVGPQDGAYRGWLMWAANECRHHHAPTVEDVLTEFGIDWEHESDCEDRAALLKEYASKLKLAEGEDA